MKRTTFAAVTVPAVLLCSLLFVAGGCSREAVGQVATLSGAYLGDVVATLATGCLHDALGVEDGGLNDEHAHDAGALHDHEH